MNVTEAHFARIFHKTSGGRNKARCLPKGCTPITRMNKLRKRFTQAVFTNTLREKALRSAKKRFFRQHIVAHHIESRAFHVKQRKTGKTHAFGCAEQRDCPRYPNTTSSERPKHYLSAHPITRWWCVWPLFAGAFWSLFVECSEYSCWRILTALCRRALSNPYWRILLALRWCALITPHWYVWPCHFSATQNKSGDNAHTICPRSVAFLIISRKCFTWNICGLLLLKRSFVRLLGRKTLVFVR